MKLKVYKPRYKFESMLLSRAFMVFISNLDKSGSIIDVGANFGWTSHFFSHFFKEVISFEPCEIPYKMLQEVALDRKNIYCYNYAVACPEICKQEVLKIQTPFDTEYSDYNYEMATIKLDQIEQLHGEYGDRFSQDNKVEEIVPVCLDDFDWDNFARPSGIKIDVEGFEYNVLMGAVETIEKYRPRLLIEDAWLTDEERDLVDNLMADLKMVGRPVDPHNTIYEPRERRWDFIWDDF